MSGLTVLIVDDDPLMLRMLAPRFENVVLNPPIARILTARTPDAALDALTDAVGPLAVVSDFNLKAPMNGLQLLAEIRRLRPDAARILFSGYSEEQIGDVSGDGAAQAFFEKPLRLDDLLDPLARAIQTHLPA